MRNPGDSWTKLLVDPADWPQTTCPVCGAATGVHGPFGGPRHCAEHEVAVIAEREMWRREQDERMAKERAANLEARRKALPELLGRAQCPPRYQGFTRASWEANYGPWERNETLRQLIGWTGDAPDTWVVFLYGKFGRRKTGLATALLGERIVAGKTGLWLDVREWVDLMRAGIKRDDGSDLAHFEAAKRADVLLFDDVGATFGDRPGYWKEQLAGVLRYRESRMKPTIATSNAKSIAELEEVDASLVSRFDAAKLAFELDGPDYRKARR